MLREEDAKWIETVTETVVVSDKPKEKFRSVKGLRGLLFLPSRGKTAKKADRHGRLSNTTPRPFRRGSRREKASKKHPPPLTGAVWKCRRGIPQEAVIRRKAQPPVSLKDLLKDRRKGRKDLYGNSLKAVRKDRCRRRKNAAWRRAGCMLCG